MAVILPTILTNSEEEYKERLKKASAISGMIQVDVIDGKFANNKTVDLDVIGKYDTTSLLEIQLMVVDPAPYVEKLVQMDHVFRIIIPYEIDAVVSELLYVIKSNNKQAGLSLNPSTEIREISYFLDDIDLLLLLAVEPGFSGQKFQERVVGKIREVKALSGGLAVEVDGGINFETAPKVVAAGADFLAANSVLYKARDFYVAYEKLVKLAAKTP